MIAGTLRSTRTIIRPLLAGLLIWAIPEHADGWPGLIGAELATFVLLPLLLALACCAPGVAGLAVPRRCRMWWRDLHYGRRPHISVRLRRLVYRADRYRCVYCRAADDLQLDHVRPWAAGGLTALFNLVTLCGPCNRVKSNYWRYRSGYVMYRGWPQTAALSRSQQLAAAASILAVERRARMSPLRWLLIAWSI